MTTADDPRDGSLTRRRAVIGLGVLGTGVAAGGLGWHALRPSPPVTVGGSLSLSGPLASIGIPLQRGLVLWAEIVTAEGGLRGREVTLDIVDDAGDQAITRAAYQDGVADWDLAISPYGSPMTAAVIETVEAAGVPCIAHTAGDRSLWNGGRAWTVQLLNPVETFLHPVLDAAAAVGARSLATVSRSDAFTPATMHGAMDKARDDGWVVHDSVVFDDESELERAMADVLEHRPDVLLGSGFQAGEGGGGFLPDAVALSQAYERTKGTASLVCWSIGASFPEYVAIRGEHATLETGVTGWKPYLDYPGNAAFIERYEDRWGEPPDSHSAGGYATGQLLAHAASAAGSLDPARLRDALFDVQTETVFGRYGVDERGMQVEKANAVVQWQGGEPVVVGPDRWRNGTLVYPANAA